MVWSGIASAARAVLDWRSLRWKIAALVAAASCTVALIVGVFVHQATVAHNTTAAQRRATASLLSALDSYQRTGQPADGTILAESQRADSRIPEQLLTESRMPEQLLATPASAADPATFYDDRDPDRPWMWAAAPAGNGQTLAVKVDMTSARLSLRALDRSIVKASLIALAVVIPLAALATELLNRRLRRVAHTAHRIAGGEHDARIGTSASSGDEVATIATAVDSMAGSLQQRLQSEQRFTADVAHELRTPLMGLVTATGLLPDGAATELVRDRVRVLHRLVEDLLEISRLDAGAERPEFQRVPLGSAVAESVAETGVPVRMRVTGDPVAVTDPRRLDRIVTNLVRNARRHGSEPIEVDVREATVVVRDHGIGFGDELLTDGPQRFRSGSDARDQGHGLGLTVALGQARIVGAGLDLANASDGGAVATVTLPVHAVSETC